MQKRFWATRMSKNVCEHMDIHGRPRTFINFLQNQTLESAKPNKPITKASTINNGSLDELDEADPIYCKKYYIVT